MDHLTDSFGRSFHYLRLSVEDSCNFRCQYCLPNGFHKHNQEPPLSIEEIGRLVRAFSSLGFWKIRLTGGEPTLRRDIVEIARVVAETNGVRRVSLSTNGYRLVELAKPLREAGIESVNVSVDSLDPAKFEQITDHHKLPGVLAGIDRCFELGFKIKVNTVLMRDFNEAEFFDFLKWTRKSPIDVRFIELMQTSGNLEFFRRAHLPASTLVEYLLLHGWTEQPRQEGDGPARNFSHPDHEGKVGVIAPYSKDFCSTCNRLRVTSRGGLRLCLFADQDYSLRPMLEREDQMSELQCALRAQLMRKEATHYLPQSRTGNVRDFAMIGG